MSARPRILCTAVRALVLATLSILASPIRAQTNAADAAFLDDLARRSFNFFWEQADPQTGLVPDRCRADGSASDSDVASSIAACGFGLTALCIGDARGWITHDQAHTRTRLSLRFFLERAAHAHGFFYHFYDKRTGERMWNCELSSIDSALLMAGVLTARAHFEDPEIRELATRLYNRVDWAWMQAGAKTLSMGWMPESGFLDARWDGYSEHMLIYLQGMSSPTHPLPIDTWHAWTREPVGTYAGLTYLQCPPLFTHQYAHAWIDFRDQRDAYADYGRNTEFATRAQQQLCLDLRSQFPLYGSNLWGLTAADGPDGYKVWGGPPIPSDPPIDGVVVPCAPGGSIPFAPAACIPALRHMAATGGTNVWTRYGLIDTYNPHTGWASPDVLGIDVGITLAMIANYRDGFVWRTFMKNAAIGNTMRQAGFVSTRQPFSPKDRAYLRTLAADTWRCIDDLAQSPTGLPYDNSNRGEFTSTSNIGLYLTDIAAAHALGLLDEPAARARLEKTLASVEGLRTWMGFQQCWNSVNTLAPGTNDTWISILDSAHLAAALLTVGAAYPDLRARCDTLVNAMDWGYFYDTNRNVLLGGYNTATAKTNPGWTLPLIGADSRLASFLAVASDRVPPASWDHLDRGTEERAHVRYFVPGWQGGGLFMQFISGLWLDDRGTAFERSAANFAYAQIQHARTNRFAAWGWSASDSPGGAYLGWGHLRDDVVTPHASVLALRQYPQPVLQNLAALEALGARHPTFGFYDAINIRTGARTDTFLTLDQSMVFLTLANALGDDCVRRWFQSTPQVTRTRAQIRDYREASPEPVISVLAEPDALRR